MRKNLKKLKKFVPKRLLPHKDHGTLKRLALWAILIASTLGTLAVILLASLFAFMSIGLPNVADLENLSAAQSTQIFDRNEKLLYTIHGEENREEVPLKDISQNLVDATLAIEDDQFFEHPGFDILAIGRGAMYQIFGIGKPRGGSTITQQYIKNTFLSSERTYTRKIRELILSIRLERTFEKEKILELYLNRIPYGNNAYGAQKASEIYFDKNAADLSIAESVILASLPQAPSRYNPFGQNKYSHLLVEFSPEELEDRNIESEFDLKIEEYARGLIGKHIELGNGESIYIPGRTDAGLKRLFQLGQITAEERQEALNELQKIEFNTYRESIKHPHFVLYIKQLLEDRYGKDVVEQGGLKVVTTIDSELQSYAEEVAREKGDNNEFSFKANNAAALTINAKTGQILAMVGSRDYFNEEIDGNVNVVLRPRQPGSSFKPFAYAQAFYNGFAPGSVIYDVPTKIGSDKPQNYNGEFLGQTTMRESLGRSINIPAIKTYFLAGEQDPIIDLVEQMGISTLSRSHSYGYPLALGAGEVSLAEMVTAYGTFANNGKRPELSSILRVENANGDVLEEWKQKEFDEVLDPQIAYLVNDILSDQAVSVGTRLFVDGKINAAKTGTSTKENKNAAGGSSVRPSDAWTIGYTPSIVTGVWTGNTDGSGLGYNANGYDTASPIFNAIMKKALQDSPAEPFPVPEGIAKVSVSKASGKLPGPDTPEDLVVSEVFPSFSIPNETEKAFFKVKIDKISGLLATEHTPTEAIEEVTFQNYQAIEDLFKWQAEINSYYAEKDITEQNSAVRYGLPPTEFDDIHTAETALGAPHITIKDPVSHSSLPTGPFIVEIDTKAPHEIERVEYYIDEEREYYTTTAPYYGHLRISKFLKEGSKHLVVAKIIDKLGYSAQAAIEIKIDNSDPEEEEDS